MFGNALTANVRKRSGRLLAISAFTILVASSGNTADLRLPIKATPRHEQPSSTTEARKLLFRQFLEWLREHDQR